MSESNSAIIRKAYEDFAHGTVNAERNGLSASFPEIHVCRMKDGKATEFREYQGDEQREDRFWS